MKPSRMFLVTLATVLMTGFAVTQAGWLRPRACRAADPDQAYDRFTTEAAQRYRHCQSSHWRACLLQQ